jgi:hypothetical protein
MADIARILNLEIVNAEEPISPGALKGSRLLYLRAPSKAFNEAEKEAITSHTGKPRPPRLVRAPDIDMSAPGGLKTGVLLPGRHAGANRGH